MRRRFAVLTMVLALFGLIAGTAGAAAPQADQARGAGIPTPKGVTEVILDPAAAKALDSLGVKVLPFFTKVRKEHGKTFIGFPIVGNPADGTIEHVGGLLLYSKKAAVALSRYTIDTEAGTLSGKVNFGKRADLFTLGKATPDGVTLALTAGAATVLNDTFGVDAFTEGLVIGYGNPKPRT